MEDFEHKRDNYVLKLQFNSHKKVQINRNTLKILYVENKFKSLLRFLIDFLNTRNKIYFHF